MAVIRPTWRHPCCSTARHGAIFFGKPPIASEANAKVRLDYASAIAIALAWLGLRCGWLVVAVAVAQRLKPLLTSCAHRSVLWRIGHTRQINGCRLLGMQYLVEYAQVTAHLMAGSARYCQLACNVCSMAHLRPPVHGIAQLAGITKSVWKRRTPSVYARMGELWSYHLLGPAQQCEPAKRPQDPARHTGIGAQRLRFTQPSSTCGGTVPWSFNRWRDRAPSGRP